MSLFSGFAPGLVKPQGMLILHRAKWSNVVGPTPLRPVYERDAGDTRCPQASLFSGSATTPGISPNMAQYGSVDHIPEVRHLNRAIAMERDTEGHKIVHLVSLYLGFAPGLITPPGMLVIHRAKWSNAVRHTPPWPVHERDSGTPGVPSVPLFRLGCYPRIFHQSGMLRFC